MELLIVISIIAIVSALALPTMNYMGRSNKVRSAVDSIQMAAAVSRAYVGLKDLGEGTGGVGDDFPGAGYQGTAIIFTQTNKIRFTYNDVTATNTDGGGNVFFIQDPRIPPPKNGFADIEEREPVKLSSEVGLLGIGNGRVVNEDDASPVLLPPPFAVRFDVHGRLISGTDFNTDQAYMVYYDGNYNGDYQPGRKRNLTHNNNVYVPAEWIPGTPQYALGSSNNDWRRPGFDPQRRRYRLPFDALESVVGVLVYDKAAFEASKAYLVCDLNEGGNPELPGYIRVADDTDHPNILRWLQKHGLAVFFNRYSGTIMEKGPLALDIESDEEDQGGCLP